MVNFDLLSEVDNSSWNKGRGIVKKVRNRVDSLAIVCDLEA